MKIPFILIILIIMFFISKTKYAKGFIGEFYINLILSKMLDKRKYIILNDILLPTENGSTQVDHIVLSEFGIFVIETKNIGHWIFSNIGPYWTQVIYNKKFNFQNPLRQNYKHIKTLEKIAGIDEKEMKNIVVFVSDCTFKTDVPDGVIKIKDIIKYIESFKEQIVENYKIENYLSQINRYKIKNTIKSKIEHIFHVESIKKEKGIYQFHNKNYKRKFLPKISLNLIFIVILLLLLMNIFKQSENMFTGIIQKNKEKIENISKKTISQPKNNNYKAPRCFKWVGS